MGRYDKESARYSRFKSKNSNGVPFFVVLMLMVFATLAGFLARPFFDDVFEPISHLFMLADGSAIKPPAKPTSEPKPSEPEPPLGAIQAIEPPAAEIILPELDSSDFIVRKAITDAAPELSPWLASDGLIRKFMVIANDLSQGLRINKHLDFLKLSLPFAVKQQNGGIFIAEESYQRYNALAQAIDHSNGDAMITVYKTFKPLLLQVFSEFSYPEEYTLETLFNKAVTEILSAPIIEGQIPLVKTPLRYQYADPQLEALNPVHKQMLRMGPENTRMIQNKLRVLLEKLETNKPEKV